VRKIFARISPKLPEKFLGHLCDVHVILGHIFSNQSTLGAILIKSKQVGRHFCAYFFGVCTDFQGFLEDFHIAQISIDFAWIFRDFAQIFTKSIHLGVRLHPLHPRLIHHCMLH